MLQAPPLAQHALSSVSIFAAQRSRAARSTMAAADVVMADGLGGSDAAAALARTRAKIGDELPVIARLYLTPVEPTV